MRTFATALSFAVVLARFLTCALPAQPIAPRARTSGNSTVPAQQAEGIEPASGPNPTHKRSNMLHVNSGAFDSAERQVWRTKGGVIDDFHD